VSVKTIQVLVWAALAIIYLLIVIKVFADEPKEIIVRYEAVLLDNDMLEVSQFNGEKVIGSWGIRHKDFVKFP